MDVVPDVIRKEIDSLDKSILVLHRNKNLPNTERIEIIRQLRTKNDSILDFIVNYRKGRAGGFSIPELVFLWVLRFYF